MATRIAPKKPLPVIYLSGPMSGYEDFNFPAFNETARRFRALGFPTLNPADFGADEAQTWEDCLRRDIATLGHAKVFIQLPGWEDSKGACLELDVALGLGLRIVDSEDIPAFVAEFFDRRELTAHYEEDTLRQNAPIVVIREVPAELSDDEVEYQRDRRRRNAYRMILEQLSRHAADRAA